METGEFGKEPLNILLACGDESNNTGDEAILAATIDLLKLKYPNSHLTVFANNPSSIKSRYKIESIAKGETLSSLTKTFLPTLIAIKRCDLFIWGGGQLIQDTSSQFYIPNHIWRLGLANHFKKKVVVFSIGASPLKSRFSKYFIKTQLAKASKISTRDSESAKVLADIGIPKDKINIVFDPALSLKDADRTKGSEILNNLSINPSKPIIGFAPRRLFHRRHGILPMRLKVRWNLIPMDAKKRFEKFKATIADSLKYAASKFDAQVLFIPMYKGPGQEDDAICKEISFKMNNNKKTFHLPKDLSAKEVKSVIANLELVIGVRMHALILAASCGVPFIGINYAPKGESFCRMMRMEDFMIDAEKLDTDWLKDKIRMALKDNVGMSEIIKTKQRKIVRSLSLADHL